MADVDSINPAVYFSPPIVDVVIIGGGLSGTLAAVVLARGGLQITLTDLHHVYPPDFRAEQLVGTQVEMLQRLDVLDFLVHDAVRAERAVITRGGRVIGSVIAPHYGIRYDQLVNRARQLLPKSVKFIKGRVIDIKLTAGLQTVTLSNGDHVRARLVVMATGLGHQLLRKMGIGRTTIRDGHSLTFGFDLEVKDPPCSVRRCWWLAASRPGTV